MLFDSIDDDNGRQVVHVVHVIDGWQYLHVNVCSYQVNGGLSVEQTGERLTLLRSQVTGQCVSLWLLR